ncbi:MAG: DUF1566 domain-containing protein, partial [bacterium]
SNSYQSGNLTWDGNDLSNITWDVANAYCNGLGWRLPTKDELLELYAVNGPGHTGLTDGYYYWSSTNYAPWGNNYFYSVIQNSTIVFPSHQNVGNYSRCVR